MEDGLLRLKKGELSHGKSKAGKAVIKARKARKAKKTSPAKKSTPNFDDILQATKITKKPASKKKNDMPHLNPNAELRECVDGYVNAKKRFNMAKGDMEEAGNAIIEFSRSEQDKAGYAGDFRKSYVIPGNVENQVKFISSNRYSVSADDAVEIKELLGDQFENLMVEKLEVSLKAEIFENEALKVEFMKLIGERFPEFFETKATLAVAEDFDKDVYDAVDKDNLTDLRTFVKPYKPSLR